MSFRRLNQSNRPVQRPKPISVVQPTPRIENGMQSGPPCYGFRGSKTVNFRDNNEIDVNFRGSDNEEILPRIHRVESVNLRPKPDARWTFSNCTKMKRMKKMVLRGFRWP